jgi:hypothetical protein
MFLVDDVCVCNHFGEVRGKNGLAVQIKKNGLVA